MKTREGRAIKLEGNPDHPLNAGALCAMGQAGLQGLYNPGRVTGPMAREGGTLKAAAWDDAIGRLAAQIGAAQGRIAVISGAGPGTFDDLLEEWTAAVGGRLVRWQPFGREPERLANRRIFGRDELAHHDFAAAHHIVSFGADFLETWGPVVEQQRGFAVSHGFDGRSIAKLVYVGPRMSLTGLNADEWHATLVFYRDDKDRVFLTYLLDGRGDEMVGGIYSYLDITPLGRQEEWEDSPEGYPQGETHVWVRLHDEYDSSGS